MVDELRHFLLVVEHGTFTEAARRAHLTQPSLSASIARLEGALGARLLHRDRHGSSLTAAGEALVPRAREVLGALALTALPGWLVQTLMVAMTLLAIARSTGRLRWKPRASQVVPAGFGIGMLAATSGGAGLLAAPLLMAAGLTAEPYIATAASGAVAMHVGRVLGYGSTGLLDGRTLALSAAITGALLLGNALGVRMRRWIPQGASARVELAALTVSVGLALAGVTR